MLNLNGYIKIYPEWNVNLAMFVTSIGRWD